MNDCLVGLRMKRERIKCLLFSQSLRDNCWKAKDEVANLEKVYEEKVKDAHIAATERVKTAKAELQSKAREDQQAFLKQLFPSITVEAQDFSMWLDEFESKVEEHLKGYTNEVHVWCLL